MKSECRSDNEKQDAEKNSLRSSWDWRPVEKSLVRHCISVVQSALDKIRWALPYVVLTEPCRYATSGVCTDANVDLRLMAWFL